MQAVGRPIDEPIASSNLLVEHDPRWSDEFLALARTLTATLKTSVLRIEHVGSTAVPGLRAKPILDVDIVVSGPSALPRVITFLGTLGYRHEGPKGIPDRDAFSREDDSVPWTEPQRPWMQHHLYVCPEKGTELRRHLAFRNLLRARADLRAEYERIKIDIAERAAHDRATYAQIKQTECRPFIEEALAQAGPL